MKTSISMIIPRGRPVRWLPYVAGLSGLNDTLTADGLLEDNDNILLAAAESLGVPPADVYPAAAAGRIEWMPSFPACGCGSVFARLDGGLSLAAFHQLEDIPPDQLFAAAGLDLYFNLAQDLNAWGHGLVLTEQIRQEHPADLRTAACEFLASFGEHLLTLSKMAGNRAIWLAGPDPDDEPEDQQDDDDDGDDDIDPEIQLEDIHPRRTDLN